MRFRKVAVLSCALIMLLFKGSAWAEDKRAVQDTVYSQKNGGFTVSVLELHEMCKEDLEESDFSKTRCGMYMQGAVGTYLANLIALMGMLDQRGQNEIGFRLSGCADKKSPKKEGTFFDIKNVAMGFIKMIDPAITKNNNIRQEAAYGGVWWYLFSCGTWEEFSVDTFKNIKKE